MTKKLKFIFFSVLLTMQLTCVFPKSLEERIADFPNLSGKDQVDTLLEMYSDDIYFARKIKFARFVGIIIRNYSETREYILERFKNTRPVPNEQTPCDFEILFIILERAVAELTGYLHTQFYESIEDYNETVHDLYKMKMDEYLRENKVIDLEYTMLRDCVLSIETGTRHITALEDLPGLLDELTAQGYEGLSIDTYCIYERSFYEQ
ncbi:MAG: hypothetical protein K5930_08525 [Treponemataceae bacterium]|nr:hypothetical protein [Treponemataceae bacterium]